MQLTYGDRKIFWGNEALVIGTLDNSGEEPIVTDLEIITGLVSVGSMEDQADSTNYPADDVPDHGTKKGSTLLTGEIVFLQTDDNLKKDLLGHIEAPNGLGTIETGAYPNKIVQYIQRGKKKLATTGEIVDGYKIKVFPNLSATGEATDESETESTDGVDAIQYTIPVQATATDGYAANGKKPAKQEFEVWAEQATQFETMMQAGLFVMFPDTEITVPTPPSGGGE